MSTRYEKRLIMPNGPLTGRVGLTNLSRDDVKNEFRWHSREWAEFLDEVRAARKRFGNAAYDAFMRTWEKAQKCEKCRKRRAAIMRAFNGPKKQRGSILLSAFLGAEAGGDCGFTASTIPNLSRFVIEPTNSFTGARLHSDGDWYSNTAGSILWGTSDGTWASDCAIADYDTRWVQNSGSALTGSSGSDGVWSAGTSTKEVYYYITNIGTLNGSFNMECRDGTSLNVLFTDGFTMNCEVDPRN